MAVTVDVENFARAETNRMFAALLGVTGGLGEWHHDRDFAPLDRQTVIRMNRDTLYSVAIVDISDGATLTLPDASGRYLSAMVINQDHYVNRVLHEPGAHTLTMAEHDTEYVAVAVRMLVDPNDLADVDAVHALQDGLRITARSSTPFVMPGYDEESFSATRRALLDLAAGIPGFARSFGRREDVDPVRHLLGTAAGWGGLPETEAFYVNVSPGLPVANYELTVGDVPVDAFWSISLYNADGFFEQNARGAYSVNSITAARNDDGTVTVHFGDGDAPNTLPIMDGWNYLVRLYRPHPEVLDGTWQFPSITA